MRVLLQHKRTGYFYQGNSEWALGELVQLRDFGSVAKAIEVVGQERLDGMRVVLTEGIGGAAQIVDLSVEPVPASRAGASVA